MPRFNYLSPRSRWQANIANRPAFAKTSRRNRSDRSLRIEPLEDRRLLTVSLNWTGPGSALSLTEDTSGATPTITISEPSPNVSLLKIDLGSGNVFAASSTISATGLTYENAGSPTTSQFATIDISLTNNISVLSALLPGDTLLLGQIRDTQGGISGITASADTIVVVGINIFNATGSVDLKATGSLRVDAGGVQTGNGTISLAADVKADGSGDDAVGTLQIGAGATVTSANATANAITLRGASIQIDASANPALIGAQRLLNMTAGAPLSGLNLPYALTFGGNGRLYVADFADGTVSEFAPGGTSPFATFTGLDEPDALAFDADGNLYVATWNGQSVAKFAPGNTTPSEILTGVASPIAMAFDGRGNLYVANWGGDSVSVFAPGSTTPTATLTGVDHPTALAFDGHGNLFVANAGAGGSGTTVSEFAAGSTTPTATLTGLNDADALAFDARGNLYVANYGYNAGTTVSVFAPGSTTPAATLTGLSGPNALAFDGNGNLYVTNYGVGTVSEFAPGSTTPTATLTGLAGPVALAFDGSGRLAVASNNAVVEFTPGIAATATAVGVVIRSSLPTSMIQLGGSGGGGPAIANRDPVTAIGDTVYHIYLAGESLAQIQTVATGTVTVGDSSQTGDILIEDCTIATTAGAATRIVQSTTGGGTILLSGSGINGNGGMVTLTSGTGGIEAGIWRGRVPLTTNGFDARGLPLTLQFYSAPTLGQQITLVNNTATPASSDPIIGTFTNLAPDKTLMVTYGRAVYAFQVDYAGGDGNVGSQ